MRSLSPERSRHLPAVSSSEMVHAEKDIDLPARHRDADDLHQVCGGVRRSYAEPMVRMIDAHASRGAFFLRHQPLRTLEGLGCHAATMTTWSSSARRCPCPPCRRHGRLSLR